MHSRPSPLRKALSLIGFAIRIMNRTEMEKERKVMLRDSMSAIYGEKRLVKLPVRMGPGHHIILPLLWP